MLLRDLIPGQTSTLCDTYAQNPLLIVVAKVPPPVTRWVQHTRFCQQGCCHFQLDKEDKSESWGFKWPWVEALRSKHWVKRIWNRVGSLFKKNTEAQVNIWHLSLRSFAPGGENNSRVSGEVSPESGLSNTPVRWRMSALQGHLQHCQHPRGYICPFSYAPPSFLPLLLLSSVRQADLELIWPRKTLNFGFFCFYLSNT